MKIRRTLIFLTFLDEEFVIVTSTRTGSSLWYTSLLRVASTLTCPSVNNKGLEKEAYGWREGEIDATWKSFIPIRIDDLLWGFSSGLSPKENSC